METVKQIALLTKFNASKAKVFESTLEEYFNITRSEEMKDLIAKIRKTQSADGRRTLKSQLPIRCPHYFRFRNNHRAQSDILPEEFTFQTCVDIDDKTQVEQALSRAYLLDKEEGLWQGKLLHAEYSASHKLHLDIRMPVGMTITETQQAYCKELGVDFDENCCSPERMIYITDEASQLYTSDEWQMRLSDEELAERRKAFEQRGLDIDGREKKSQPTSEPVDGKKYPDTYQDIPYSLIVETLTDQMGGAPEHGNRNDFIFRMCCHLRHVCDNDPNWIRQILPDFGEDHNRVTDTIQSACKRKQSAAMTTIMKRTLDLSHRQMVIENGDEEQLLQMEPQMPKRLPPFIKHITSKLPEKFRPAVASGIFPALGVHLGGVKVIYRDNSEMECTFLNALIAPMASGKSCIKKPIETCTKEIMERDNLSYEREMEWKETINTRSNDSEKPKRPKDLCRQYIESDLTNAALTQLLIDAARAGNKALYLKTDEIEALYSLGNGKRTTTDNILKRDFDNDLYGQERVGTMSVSGRAPLRLNVNASTTPGQAQNFFKGNVTDGKLSRFDVCTIVADEDDDEIPEYGIYDEKFQQKVSAYMAILEETKGTIVCKHAQKMAKELNKVATDRAAMLDFPGYKKLSNRSIVIAFRKACVLYILNGQKWSKEIDEFCRWTYDYDMWCKMRFFFEAIKTDIDVEEKSMKRGRPNLVKLMPNEFTREDARSMRIRMGLPNPDPKDMLGKWVQRHFVAFDEDTKTYHKTPEFLAKQAG